MSPHHTPFLTANGLLSTDLWCNVPQPASPAEEKARTFTANEWLNIANDENDVIVLQYFWITASANMLTSATEEIQEVTGTSATLVGWLIDSGYISWISLLTTLYFYALSIFGQAQFWSFNNIATSLISQLFAILAGAQPASFICFHTKSKIFMCIFLIHLIVIWSIVKVWVWRSFVKSLIMKQKTALKQW